MARTVLITLVIFAFVAVAQGAEEESGGEDAGVREDINPRLKVKKWKSCEKRIQRFERCLEKGYKSKAGCISGEGTLKYKFWRKCRRLENKIAQRCTDYVCEKPPSKTLDNCWVNGYIATGVELDDHYTDITYDECDRACNEAECEAFNFYNIDGETQCRLIKNFSHFTDGDDEEGAVEAKLRDCPERSEVDPECIHKNTIFKLDPKSDLTGVETLEECERLCQITNDCKSFSISEANARCLLFDKEVRSYKEGIEEDESWRSMNMEHCD